MPIYLQGLLLGISIAVPVGPIGVLCIRRTLLQGRLHGLMSGLGAATADAIYGAVAALGLSALMTILIDQSVWIQLVGGLFLCYLAYRTFASAPPAAEAGARLEGGLPGAYATTLLLTLANPMTIVSFAGMFAGFDVGEGSRSALLLVAGVFCGSALWWLALSLIVGGARKRLPERWLRGINRLSGVVLLIFGIVILVKGLAEWP